MRQHRYYAEHHDTSPDERFQPSPCIIRDNRLPRFVQLGPQAGDLASMRFLAPRKLRRLDLEGPTPLALSINGRVVGIVRPGENSFDPPVSLEAGDTLQLEAIDPNEAENTGGLSGWTPAPSITNESRARGGCHV